MTTAVVAAAFSRRASRVALAGTLAGVCFISTGSASSQAAAPSARADWPTFHFDAAHSGANPFETTIGPSNVGSLVRRWSFRDLNLASVAVSVGLLYLYGTNALTALHAKSGSVAWSDPMPGWMSSPTAVDGRVFVLTGDIETLSAFDSGTGALDWSSRLADVSFTTSPTVSGGRVFVGDRDGMVYAFDEATGALDWTAPTATYGTDVSPTVADGVVFVTSIAGRGGALFALDAASGATLWEHPMPSGVTSSTPAVSGGLVYIASGGDVASGRGFLLAVREGDGTLAWQAPMGSRGDSSPAVSGGTVFTTSDDGALHAYDATSGAEMWTASTGSFFFDSSPAVANGLLYVASGDSVIHAFDVATGLELWHDTLAQGYSDSIPSPVVVNGFLYIGSDDKWFAFSLPKRATS